MASSYYFRYARKAHGCHPCALKRQDGGTASSCSCQSQRQLCSSACMDCCCQVGCSLFCFLFPRHAGAHHGGGISPLYAGHSLSKPSHATAGLAEHVPETWQAGSILTLPVKLLVFYVQSSVNHAPKHLLKRGSKGVTVSAAVPLLGLYQSCTTS